MADDALRALERRFRETQSVEDEAAWLSERVRVGELSGARVHVAAGLRYPAALRLLPLPSEPLPPANLLERSRNWISKLLETPHPSVAFEEDPAALVEAIAALGDEALQRAACAAFAARAASGVAEPVRTEALNLLALGEQVVTRGAPVEGFDEERIAGALDRRADDALAMGNPTGTLDSGDMFGPYTWQFAERAREFVRVIRSPDGAQAEPDLTRLCASANAYGEVSGTSRDALHALKTVFARWLLGSQPLD